MEPERTLQQFEERRTSQRKESQERRFWHPTPGKIVDTCSAGMSVQTKIRLEVGETYVFKTRHGSESLKIPATVKWSRLEMSTGDGAGDKPLAFYRSGLFFPDSLDAQAAKFLLQASDDLTIQ